MVNVSHGLRRLLAVSAVVVVSSCGQAGQDASNTAGPTSLAPALVTTTDAGVVATSAPGGTDAPDRTASPTTLVTESVGGARVLATDGLAGVKLLSGQPFDRSTLVGKPTVAWFWAPWCVICRGEAPDVVEVVNQYADRVNFIGVAGLGENGEMLDFVDETKTGLFPHVEDPDGSVWAWYEVFSQPSFAFMTADGRLETFTGSLSANDLRGIIEKLLNA
jgi:thiol-disulfide isomerase/thioredoxin